MQNGLFVLEFGAYHFYSSKNGAVNDGSYERTQTEKQAVWHSPTQLSGVLGSSHNTLASHDHNTPGTSPIKNRVRAAVLEQYVGATLGRLTVATVMKDTFRHQRQPSSKLWL